MHARTQAGTQASARARTHTHTHTHKYGGGAAVNAYHSTRTLKGLKTKVIKSAISDECAKTSPEGDCYNALTLSSLNAHT